MYDAVCVKTREADELVLVDFDCTATIMQCSTKGPISGFRVASGTLSREPLLKCRASSLQTYVHEFQRLARPDVGGRGSAL